MRRLKSSLEDDVPIREILPDLDPEDLKILRGFGFLSAKPLLILLNVDESQLGAEADALLAAARERFARPGVAIEVMAGKIEMEIGRLDPDDAALFMEDLGIAESSLDRVIQR